MGEPPAGRMSSHGKRSQDFGADASRGSIPLVFGWNQYFNLAAAAFAGVLPITAWGMTLGIGFVGAVVLHRK